MPKLILIRGVPGAGKSTLAQQFVDSSFVRLRLEADQYFYNAAGEYKFDASKLKQAHEWCQDGVRMALGYGYDIAVSNTSTTEKEVETYKRIADEYEAEFISIIVENRHDGVNIHNVPEDKLDAMRNRFSIKL